MPHSVAPSLPSIARSAGCLLATTLAPCVAQVAWSQVTTNPGPAAHSGNAWDSARQRLVVFGGQVGVVELGSTLEWDGSNWTMLTPTAAPAARSRPAMTFD